jgi:flagellar hook assembly protein FlgD
MAGFAEGNPFVLKLRNSRNNQEFILEPEIINGTSTFAKHETTVASLKNYTATGWEGITGSDLTEINCYPNPFSDEVTIEINLKSDAEVEVEVLNQLGQRVKAITTKRNISNGIHRLKWNGKNTANQQVSSGIFYVRIMMGSEIYFKKVVYSKIE